MADAGEGQDDGPAAPVAAQIPPLDDSKTAIPAPTPSFPVPPAARSNKKFIGPFSSFAAGITGMIEANDVVSDALESDASPCSS